MNNNHLPSYREIIKYEGKITELLNHNVHKYNGQIIFFISQKFYRKLLT